MNQFPKSIQRKCKECKETKECKLSRIKNGKPEYRYRCVCCHNAWERSHRKKTRKKLNEQTKKRKHSRKKKCIDYLGGSCSRCLYDKSHRALTFHHKDRAIKEFSISQIKDHSWSKIKAELDKCELICFNCHMEEEEKHDNGTLPEDWECCF